MSSKVKYIHITTCEKFINSYVKLISHEFTETEHLFFILNKNKKYPIEGSNVIFLSSIVSYFKLILSLVTSKKVIFHSFSGFKALLIPFCFRFILKKSYWLVWGADLYAYLNKPKCLREKVKESIRQSVFKNIGHIISYIQGDLDLASDWYNNNSQQHVCLLYESNIFKALPLPDKKEEGVTVLVGNSADNSNNHFQVFNAINTFSNINVIAPLSYGDPYYANEVKKQGYQLYGDNFVALTNFMGFNEYLSLLANVDIAIFHHDRQQAMGNIITLLGLGKKVYVNKKTTSYSTLISLGLHIFELENFNAELLNKDHAEHNMRIIKEQFSYGNLVEQWEWIFHHEHY